MYLSQVGLIVVLAQIGAGVPATQAKLPVLNGINSRMGIYESVSHGQSSFFMDAAQVAAMLRSDTRKCLNIIDEFGKGTAEDDGMGLLAATLEEIWRTGLEKECVTMCATHFLEIVRAHFLPIKDGRMCIFSMEVLPREAVKQVTNPTVTTPVDDKTRNEKSGAAVRTYRVVRGAIATETRALQCAMEAGVRKSTLRRAAHIAAAGYSENRIMGATTWAGSNRRVAAIETATAEFVSNYPVVGDGSEVPKHGNTTVRGEHGSDLNEVVSHAER